MRKRQTVVQAGTIAKVVALGLFLGGSGVGYVFQDSQIKGLNKQFGANEDQIRELKNKLQDLKMQIEQATTRQSLEASARHFHLPLQEPEPNHLIPLPEPEVRADRLVSLAVQK